MVCLLLRPSSHEIWPYPGNKATLLIWLNIFGPFGDCSMQGFCPEDEIPRRHSRNLAYVKESTYSWNIQSVF